MTVETVTLKDLNSATLADSEFIIVGDSDNDTIRKLPVSALPTGGGDYWEEQGNDTLKVKDKYTKLVSGNTEMHGNVTATGNTTINGNLIVNGQSIQGKTLSLDDGSCQMSFGAGGVAMTLNGDCKLDIKGRTDVGSVADLENYLKANHTKVEDHERRITTLEEGGGGEEYVLTGDKVKAVLADSNITSEITGGKLKLTAPTTDLTDVKTELKDHDTRITRLEGAAHHSGGVMLATGTLGAPNTATPNQTLINSYAVTVSGTNYKFVDFSRLFEFLPSDRKTSKISFLVPKHSKSIELEVDCTTSTTGLSLLKKEVGTDSWVVASHFRPSSNQVSNPAYTSTFFILSATITAEDKDYEYGFGSLRDEQMYTPACQVDGGVDFFRITVVEDTSNRLDILESNLSDPPTTPADNFFEAWGTGDVRMKQDGVNNKVLRLGWPDTENPDQYNIDIGYHDDSGLGILMNGAEVHKVHFQPTGIIYTYGSDVGSYSYHEVTKLRQELDALKEEVATGGGGKPDEWVLATPQIHLVNGAGVVLSGDLDNLIIDFTGEAGYQKGVVRCVIPDQRGTAYIYAFESEILEMSEGMEDAISSIDVSAPLIDTNVHSGNSATLVGRFGSSIKTYTALKIGGESIVDSSVVSRVLNMSITANPDRGLGKLRLKVTVHYKQL